MDAGYYFDFTSQKYGDQEALQRKTKIRTYKVLKYMLRMSVLYTSLFTQSVGTKQKNK